MTDDEYLISFLQDRKYTRASKNHHEYLSYYGLNQSSVQVLVDGVVKASVITHDGREANIAYIEGPSPVSLLRDEASEQAESPFNVRVESERASYYSVPRPVFWRFVNADARLQRYVKDYYRTNLEHALKRTRYLTMNGKTGAVGALLYELARRFGVPDERGVRIGLSVTNEDLAGFCGASSRNSVNRIMRGFRELGVVSTGSRDADILVLDMDYLGRYLID